MRCCVTPATPPLWQLHALLRDPKDEQSFGLQYTSGSCRTYSAASRDAILASILEACHAAGHVEVHVLSNAQGTAALGLRLQPLALASDADLEAIYLKVWV